MSSRDAAVTGKSTNSGRAIAAKSAEQSRFLRFLAIGSIGFLVDGGILGLEVHGFGVNPYLGRVPSFLVAVTVTWWLNRRHSFAQLGQFAPAHEYRRYVLVQTLGAVANLGVYAGAIHTSRWCAQYPLIAFAVGACVALVLNYSLARAYVFPGGPRRE